MQSFPIGGGRQLVYLPISETTLVLPNVVINALRLSSEFRTVDAHRAAFSGLNGQLSVAIEDLIKLGVFVTEPQVHSWLSSPLPEESRGRIEWLAIPTSNRPGELKRALTTYTEHLTRFGRTPRILIADNSAPDKSELCQSMLRDLRLNHALLYIGEQQRQRYIQRLVKHGDIPEDVAVFALTGRGGNGTAYGSNRNAILLQTAGDLLLSVDDDTVCNVARIPQQLPADALQIARHGDGDVGQFWFFQNLDEAVRFVEPLDADILQMHEDLLGSSLRVPAQRAAAMRMLDLRNSCPHVIQHLNAGGASIRITMNGTVGDSGAGSQFELRAYPNAPTRARLIASESVYRTATNSRFAVRQHAAQTITHADCLMSTCLGIDNRNLLPPFMPVHRGEDSIFGAVLSRISEDIYFGHVPFVLGHVPPGERTVPRSGELYRFPLADILMSCLQSWTAPPGQSSASERLRAIGAHLQGLANQPANDFRRSLRHFAWSIASRRIQSLTNTLHQAAAAPKFWADDIERQTTCIERAMMEPEFGVPFELADVNDPGRGLRETQNMLRQTGRMMEWWPQIVNTAQSLSAKGESLAETLTTK
jgi:hypothetical protein